MYKLTGSFKNSAQSRGLSNKGFISKSVLVSGWYLYENLLLDLQFRNASISVNNWQLNSITNIAKYKQ